MNEGIQWRRDARAKVAACPVCGAAPDLTKYKGEVLVRCLKNECNYTGPRPDNWRKYEAWNRRAARWIPAVKEDHP